MSDQSQGATTCTHLATCPMFKVFASQASGNIFRRIYCESNYQGCARYQKSEKGESVSDYLLPNGTFLAGR